MLTHSNLPTSEPPKPIGDRPILLTGAHRSGTTWVARILAAAQNVQMVYEPFNYNFPCPGICDIPIEHRFHYVCGANEAAFIPPIERMLRHRYDICARARSIRGIRDVAKATLELGSTTAARIRGSRTLIKDPAAVFSAPWMADRFGLSTVVLIRHPAGFVNSLIRRGWIFHFRFLLEQELLMTGPLAPHRDEIEAAAFFPPDIVGQGALLWRLIYSMVARWRTERLDWLLVRHEDLSEDPEGQFGELFDAVGLEFGRRARRRIRALTHSSAKHRPQGATHFLTRDSRSVIREWRAELDKCDQDRIRAVVGDVFNKFYAEAEW